MADGKQPRYQYVRQCAGLQAGAASRGELQMVVHEVLPLEQAVLAHQKMAAGEVFGRIVLVPSGSPGRVLRTA